MGKASSYVIALVALVFVASAVYGYQTYFITKDFTILNTTECNPDSESCFLWCENGECEQDYYKKIVKKAYNIPDCNPAYNECEPLVCAPDEVGCEIIYCAEDTLDEGEICSSSGREPLGNSVIPDETSGS